MICFRILEGVLLQDAHMGLGKHLSEKFKVEYKECVMRRRTFVFLTSIEHLTRLEESINDYYRAVNNDDDIECELLINLSSNIITVLARGYYELRNKRRIRKSESEYQRINKEEQ
ncbi:hypothetical protein ABMA75_03195 [Halobacteriovorax sp. ZH4_bin.1]|uniref:hypothetical protein n=1 Tax=unclassified Halobacteriovorax TaxID=2639665 RepID=UPI00370FD48D